MHTDRLLDAWDSSNLIVVILYSNKLVYDMASSQISSFVMCCHLKPACLTPISSSTWLDTLVKESINLPHVCLLNYNWTTLARKVSLPTTSLMLTNMYLGGKITKCQLVTRLLVYSPLLLVIAPGSPPCSSLQLFT